MMVIHPLNLISAIVALASLVDSASAAGPAASSLVCKVQPTGGNDHDVILKALKQCKNGGTVRFTAPNKYILGSPITKDETPELDGTQIVIEGTINYEYEKEAQSEMGDVVYWVLSGSNVDISGSGSIKGGGLPWWKKGVHGPKIMQLDINGGSMKDITLQNGPSHMLFVHGSDFLIDGVTIKSISNDYDNAYPQNTDGINISGKRITVRNVVIVAGDDCISFLDGADTVHINHVTCGGPTHGISVGNLGDSGEDGNVKNILVENIVFDDGGLADLGPKFKNYTASQFVARIKTSGDANSHGTVSNVTWQHITAPFGISESGKTAVYITQNHNVAGEEQNKNAKSGIKIIDVTFSDISGGKIPEGDKHGAVSITCSAAHHCDNILIEGIKFKGDTDELCQNARGLAKDCTDCGDDC